MNGINKKRGLIALGVAILVTLVAIFYFQPIRQRGDFERSRVFRSKSNNDIVENVLVNDGSINKEYVLEKNKGYVFLSIYEPHFSITGFPYLEKNDYALNRLESGVYYSKGIEKRVEHTAGGRIRFRTDANSICVRIKYNKLEEYPWFTLTGSAGVDIYMGAGNNKKWLDTVYPKNKFDKFVEKRIEINNEFSPTDITINLPLYASIESIEIGLPTDSKLNSPTPYSIEKPIVFYGSSITQGCSASRSGTSFPEIVSRYFDSNIVNLGFSSSCKGEESVAETISKIDMAALVIEFDHNAETVDDLLSAYGTFYSLIRENNSDIPIILISRISGGISCTINETRDRDSVIEGVYNNAVLSGDTHIYFIDGCDLAKLNQRDMLLVDGKHPNDKGMELIAAKIIECLKIEWKNNEAID